jgi:riboflavin biosynthesis pyrimidine reductase
VVDSRGKVPASARLFGLPGETALATTDAAPHEVQLGWKEAGAEVVVLPGGPGGVALAPLFDMLGERGLLEVYCEGGPTLASTLLDQDLVDRLELHYGPVLLGGGGLGLADVGVTTIADARRWSLLGSQPYGDTVVLELERSR